MAEQQRGDADEGAPPPIIRAPADILAAVGTPSHETADREQPEGAGLGDMMRGGLSAFRARSKQLGATLEASVAQLSAPPGTGDAVGEGSKEQAAPTMPPGLAEPEPEESASTVTDASADAVMSPGPTAFGLRQVENRADPWCLGAISAESYGNAIESEQPETCEAVDKSVDGGSDIGLGSDHDAIASSCSDTVDARTWRSVIWPDYSSQNLARLASSDGRTALLRCLRNAATAQPEPTPIAPEVWWRLGDLLAVGLTAAVESGELEFAVDLLVRIMQ